MRAKDKKNNKRRREEKKTDHKRFAFVSKNWKTQENRENKKLEKLGELVAASTWPQAVETFLHLMCVCVKEDLLQQDLYIRLCVCTENEKSFFFIFIFKALWWWWLVLLLFLSFSLVFVLQHTCTTQCLLPHHVRSSCTALHCVCTTNRRWRTRASLCLTVMGVGCVQFSIAVVRAQTFEIATHTHTQREQVPNYVLEWMTFEDDE